MKKIVEGLGKYDKLDPIEQWLLGEDILNEGIVIERVTLRRQKVRNNIIELLESRIEKLGRVVDRADYEWESFSGANILI